EKSGAGRLPDRRRAAAAPRRRGPAGTGRRPRTRGPRGGDAARQDGVARPPRPRHSAQARQARQPGRRADRGPVMTTGERPTPPGGPARRRASTFRSSSVMAAGTLASRFTGFLRTFVLLYALGTKNLGDAYNVANSVPNAVYNLAVGGILTA